MNRIALVALATVLAAGCSDEPTEPALAGDREVLRVSTSISAEASQTSEVLVATHYTFPEHSSLLITGEMTVSEGYVLACDPPGWYRAPANVYAGPEHSLASSGMDHDGMRNFTVLTNVRLPVGTRIYDLVFDPSRSCGDGFLFRGTVKR